MVLSNPAALKVVTLQCDLFSLGRVGVYDANENEIENDPFLNFIANPNPFQTEAQFKWDFMFWLMLGNCNTYIDSKILSEKNKMYHLQPDKLYWPDSLQKEADKLIFSDGSLRDRAKTVLEYRYVDGTTFRFPLEKLAISHDLSNGTGNWYKGSSRWDALFKVVSNSEAALDSKNINVRYAGKFLVGSTTSGANDLRSFGLGEEEKEDIRNKMDGSKNVFPLKSMVEIRRFVENMRVLELGNAFQEDFFIMGGLFNIPKDVLEAYIKSSTFENQEKARMAHVAYTLQPKGNEWMNSFERYFGYDKQGKNIRISWDHLPMMGVFKAQESTTKKTQIETLTAMLSAGIPIKQVNEFLGTDFKIEKPEPKQENNGNDNEAGQGGNQNGSGEDQGIEDEQPND